MKNKVFQISNKNWGQIVFGGGDWIETKIYICDDFTVDITNYFSTYPEKKEEKLSSKIDENTFNQIKEIMEHIDEYDFVDAYDGSAWEYIYYKNNAVYKERRLGYIYGVEQLEQVAEILRYMIKEAKLVKQNENDLDLNNSKYEFYKNNDNDQIWWVENVDTVGEHLFTFDKKNIFNLFKDYPYKLTKEEKEIFDKENSYWAEYFKERN